MLEMIDDTIKDEMFDLLPNAVVWAQQVQEANGEVIDFEFVYANKKADEAIGHPKGRLTGLRVLRDRILGENACHENFKIFLQVYTTGQVMDYTFRSNYNGRTTETILRPFRGGVLSTTRNQEEVKRLAYEKLQESEEKYRRLFQSMDQGYCTLEIIFGEEGKCTDYRYLEINPAFERQSGLINAIGKTIRELAPDIEPKWFTFYGGVALTGQPIRLEEESKALNKWYEVYAVRIGNPEERKVGVFFTDITQRKRAEEAIRQSESNLSNMILQSPVAMCILMGPSFVVKIANKRTYELWGKSAEEMLDKPVFEGLPEARGQGLEELLQHVYTTGETFTASERPVQLPRNGKIETVYVNFVYDPFKSSDGTITGVMAVAIDVTEQVVSRLKLEESHKELQFVMDVMPTMVWHTLPDGTADFFNQVYQDYTGRPMEGLTGHGWIDLIHPDDIELTRKTWKHSLEGGNDNYTVEHRLRGKDGTYNWFLTRGVPLKDEKGATIKWYGTSTNIHEQKSVEEELEQRVDERTADLLDSNKNLKRANTELEQFTYVSHHDLQEPLRKIVIFTDMVQSDNKNQLTEASRQRLERVTSAARRMSAALRDVLDYASLNREETATQVDLDEMLAAVQQDLELLITEKKANITSQSLPTINAIPGQMHQLFYNLLNNALKFTKSGEPPLINITCKKLDASEASTHTELNLGKPYYHIMVLDNGIGFNPDAAEKIFGMFQRLHNKEVYAGTGIGLALVKKVVMNHQGKIWAESIPGEGASFNLLLPVE